MIKRKIPGSENKTEEGERTKFISLWEIVVEVFTRRGGGGSKIPRGKYEDYKPIRDNNDK